MAGSDPLTIIRDEPMSSFQVIAVAICIALNALDGFDVLAIAFAAPGISKQWGLGPGALGIVISTGLAGMAAGSLLLAPLADAIGRRPQIMLCLTAMALGMLLSATAGNVYMLAFWRVITGLGIGGMLASINAMTAEYSNGRNRGLCVSLMAIGYPIGGVVGGSVAVWLLGRYDWRSVFIFGGIVSAALLPVVWRRLPESIAFLSMKRPASALDTINRILARMGHGTVAELPPPVSHDRGSGFDIFKGDLRSRTIAVCSAYFLHILTFYYVLGWIPAIVAALGFTAQSGTSVSVWANLGGIAGGILLGGLSRRYGVKPLVMLAMLATAAMLVVFGRIAPDINLLKAVAFIMGFFMFAGVVGLYAVLATAYPTRVRATGTGFAIGLGRAGGVLGPAIGGWLMHLGVGRPGVALAMALGSVLAAAALLALPGHLRSAAPEAIVRTRKVGSDA